MFFSIIGGTVKPISGPLSSIKVQQPPVSGGIQKDTKATNVGQLVNAKFINIQSNSDGKIKSFSGIR